VLTDSLPSMMGIVEILDNINLLPFDLGGCYQTARTAQLNPGLSKHCCGEVGSNSIRAIKETYPGVGFTTSTAVL
jgi:hypothetical protein